MAPFSGGRSVFSNALAAENEKACRKCESQFKQCTDQVKKKLVDCRDKNKLECGAASASKETCIEDCVKKSAAAGEERCKVKCRGDAACVEKCVAGNQPGEQCERSCNNLKLYNFSCVNGLNQNCNAKEAAICLTTNVECKNSNGCSLVPGAYDKYEN